ncbi:MAG TPA: PQQ-dependent dehydrogenase, methanol/ethanol family [Steroidobacteraceae bacterium]|nr:PQQ-dependent dehydrogenase, methanol/ethanol family [Steroidobacteraceae bacterium]
MPTAHAVPRIRSALCATLALAVAQVGNASQGPGEWYTAGRDTGQTYYSPLGAIGQANVEDLGFAWQYPLGMRRGVEATPIVINGVMYTSGPWGHVYALDAATGKLLWTYDPEVPGGYGKWSCCDVVNRGVAVWKGRVYVASLDGFLHAIDARTGKRIWRVNTLPAHTPESHYFVTGAPVVAGDVVVIGYGGSDFKGNRGSVSAYSLDSGAFRWRFYTVPRNPELGPQDQPQLHAAEKTWPSRYDWSMGAGGAVWGGLAYDPKLQLVYFGTGNAAPYHGGMDAAKYGDELYVAAIMAVHAGTGKIAWYYQEVPAEGWDYDTCNPLVLAQMTIRGRARPVIMQASKDGFLYVLDRSTGEFLAGNPFTYVNWTKGLDPRTHRPIPRPSLDWTRAPALIWPGATGAHSWQPMSFDAQTGLVYIPVIDSPMVYVNSAHRRAGLIEGNFDLAFFFPGDYSPKDLESLFGPLPSLSDLARGGPPPVSRGFIRAVQPMTGKIVWQRQTASFWDGGVLSTGGNLVFQGDADGYLNVYAADTGTLLKRIDVGTSIMAAPMTYTVGGVQYLSVMAGYGGGMLYDPFPVASAAYKYGNEDRIITFRLGGGATPKPPPFHDAALPALPPRPRSAEAIARGEVLYNRFCARCHTFGRALLPDLRRTAPALSPAFYEIVLHGIDQVNGMGRFDDELTHADAEAIQAYLIDQAWQMQRRTTP